MWFGKRPKGYAFLRLDSKREPHTARWSQTCQKLGCSWNSQKFSPQIRSELIDSQRERPLQKVLLGVVFCKVCWQSLPSFVQLAFLWQFDLTSFPLTPRRKKNSFSYRHPHTGPSDEGNMEFPEPTLSSCHDTPSNGVGRPGVLMSV